jgi:hypothetical protein
MIRGDSFQFQKRRQHFIGMHNETLSVSAMRICNPDRSPLESPSLRTGLEPFAPKLRSAVRVCASVVVKCADK